jgi:molybdenum cofactor cytidylyltransferase
MDRSAPGCATAGTVVTERAPPVVDAVVLAAGASHRMAPHHKLLAQGADGRALIAVTLDRLIDAGLPEIVVVLGDHAEAVRAAIGARAVRMVRCADAAAGMAHSLGVGLGALGGDADAVLVALGDMPLIDADLVSRLTAGFRPGAVVVPVCRGQRGNPVLWDRSFVPAMRALRGDQGARGLLAGAGDALIEVAVQTDAMLRDADTAEALRALPGGPWLGADGLPI